MEYIPVETTNTWTNCTFLNPSKLIPALMRYDPQHNSTKNKEVRIIYERGGGDQSHLK